jgi:hypothetical protein
LTEDELVGQEVGYGTGRLPSFFRWLNIGLYLGAIVYLLVNQVEGYLILIVLAAALLSWLVYFVVAKKPPEP